VHRALPLCTKVRTCHPSHCALLQELLLVISADAVRLNWEMQVVEQSCPVVEVMLVEANLKFAGRFESVVKAKAVEGGIVVVEGLEQVWTIEVTHASQVFGAQE
jgi:hypothetical protein